MPDDPVGLDAWLNRIESLHPIKIDLGLERVRPVADRLQLDLAAVVITVGGTNGKGSTCAILESVLHAAGYRVGLYTSPHLVRFNERARIGGVAVSDDELIDAFHQVEAARAEVALTYFEFTTLAILLCFARARLDAVILEVGLGGRLDAVNLIDADCSIITSVDIDHVEYLGPTRESIGYEKAHIFRAGRPAICADPVPPESLVEHAHKVGADLWLFGRDFNYAGDRQQWSYGGRAQRRNSMAYPALRGANQLLNASAVLAALEDHGWPGLSPEAASAADAYRLIAGREAGHLRACASGAALLGEDRGDELARAATVGASTTVPLLGTRGFVPAP